MEQRSKQPDPEIDNEEEEEEDENDEDIDQPRIPTYPFPSDFCIEFDGSDKIEACRHHCLRHPEHTKSIVICLPGVHGGVGPCRTPPNNFDENALYPTFARSITSQHDVDVYRGSWRYMRPSIRAAVGGVCRLLHHA